MLSTAHQVHIINAPVENEMLAEVRSSFPDEDIAVLRQRLEVDGYLCMRGLLPREAVLGARRVMYEQMKKDGTLDDDSTFECPTGRGTGSYMGQKHVTHHPDFLAAVEHPNAYAFFDALFEEQSRSFDYKWARGVPYQSAGVNAHCDNVYMGRGSERLKTMWVPMGDIELANGPMCILENSHRAEGFAKIRQTYGQMDVDRDKIVGGFSDDPHELSERSQSRWLAGDFAAGDVII
ncbi:MAG: phytanoyl-CoA dioxygenase family protein, partial [Planctomycetes bacterium]|nr:phytanoyl-CoA dioxygenase family protein [Planctomycetota bacterium]